MRTTTILLLTLALACFGTVPTSGATAPETPETVVAFTVSIDLRPDTTDLSSVPMHILERLSEEPSLESLRMKQSQRREAYLRAEFRFPSLALFLQWYAEKSTGELIAEFKAAGATGVVGTSLELQRIRVDEPSED